MINRNRNMTAGTFLDQYVTAYALFVAVVAVVVFALGAVGFIVNQSAESDTHASDVAAQQYFGRLFKVSLGQYPAPPASPAVRQWRREEAAAFLASPKAAQDPLFWNISRADLRRVARTGYPPNLRITTVVTPFRDYLGWALRWLLPIALLCMYVAVASEFMGTCNSRDHRMVELPWRRWWLYLFVVPWMPVMWPAFAISYVRMRRNAPVVHERYRRPPDDIFRDPGLPDVDTATSAGNYVNLKAGGRKRTIEKALSRARETVADLGRQLRTLGNQVSDKRQEQVEARAELVLLESSLELAGDLPAEDEATSRAEYYALLGLPYVQWVEVTTSRIRVFLRGLVWDDPNGPKRDFGDWILEISVATGAIHLDDVRNTDRQYEGFLYGRSFCFGGASTNIQNALSRGDYIHALTTIIRALCSVNDNQRRDARARFPRVRDHAE